MCNFFIITWKILMHQLLGTWQIFNMLSYPLQSACSLESNLEGLAGVLEADLPNYKSKILRLLCTVYVNKRFMNPGDNVLSTLKCLGMFGRCVYVPYHLVSFHGEFVRWNDLWPFGELLEINSMKIEHFFCFLNP